MGWITPENFKADWYGWVTNQAGHVLLGIFAAVAVAVLWWYAFDEYPYRKALALALVLVFVASELAQGWKGGDAVEDILFRTYGVAFPLATLQESQRFSVELTPDLFAMLTIMGLVAFHMAVGVGIRVWQACKSRT